MLNTFTVGIDEPTVASGSYTWVTNTRQGKGLVPKAIQKGTQWKQRPRAPYIGMMLHQDGSPDERVPGKLWDLIVTMDGATSVKELQPGHPFSGHL